MFKIMALIVLVVIVMLESIRFIARKHRMCDRYIRRDYDKFRRLDAQLQQGASAPGQSVRERHPDVTM